jgi:hypothetical protein
VASDREWDRLIGYLNRWATARVTTKGIEVTYEQPAGGQRTVEIVVSPDGWSEYIGVIWGTEDPAATDIRTLVMAVPADKLFLVYDREQWEASATPDLLPDPDDGFQPGPGGHWVTFDGGGYVTNRYADWIDGR